METIHTTNKAIKRMMAEKLLSGEELTNDDREQIAYELGCTSLLEQAYRHLCRKLWVQSKPSTLKLTKAETELLSKAFPRSQKGRKRGTTDQTITAAMVYDLLKGKHENAYDAYAEVAVVIKAMHGTNHDIESVRKMIVRGNKELKKSKYEYVTTVDEIACNIKARHDDYLMKRALEEHFKPTHIEE